MATTGTMQGIPTQLSIGGRFRDAAGGERFEVDPATGEVLAAVADGTIADGLDAAAAAHAARPA